MRITHAAVALAVLAPGLASAQVENMGPKAATYITDADVKKVNALPGVDRQIVSVDIGKLNEAVGIVIIPAGVAHGWVAIPDHVDYLTVRPDPDRVLAPYVHPVLKQQ